MSGDQVEDMIAVALLRENPHGVHVRASRGDGGIDIFVPLEDAGSGINFQVKNFNTSLGDVQKQQIRKSLKATDRTSQKGDFVTTLCYVVMPLNPSNDDVRWLKRHAQRYSGMKVEFYGLSHILGLLSKYPEVVDYFAGRGKEQLNSAVSQVTNVLRQTLDIRGADKAGPMEPNEVIEHLSSVVDLVNDHDPFYRYEFSVGKGPRFSQSEPNLVASVAVPTSMDSVVTVEILQRIHGASDFRPCSFVIRPTPVGVDEENEFQEFRRFGTDATFSATFDANLPGGLGKAGELGKVTIQNVSTGSVPNRVRLHLLDENKSVLSEVTVKILSTSTGLDGLNHQFNLVSGSDSFRMMLRFDRENESMSIGFGLKDIQGRIASEVLRDINFISLIGLARYLRISLPYGPLARDLHDIGTLPESKDWQLLSSLVRDLNDIQQITNRPIFVPEFKDVDTTTRVEISRCAALARGEEVVLHWNRLKVDLWQGVRVDSFGDKVTLAAVMPLELKLGRRAYDLGRKLIQYKVAELEESSVDENGNGQAVYIPSGDATAVMKWVQGVSV